MSSHNIEGTLKSAFYLILFHTNFMHQKWPNKLSESNAEKQILLPSCWYDAIANLSSDWVRKRTRAAFDIQSATKMETWRKNFVASHVTYQQAPGSFTGIQNVVGILRIMGKKCLCVQAKNGLHDTIFKSSVYEKWRPKCKIFLRYYGVVSYVLRYSK